MTSATPRRTKRTEQLVARRAALLEAAERVALERGLAAARVADVAAATDVSPGLVHYHFSSKDDLFVEMLRAAADRELTSVHRIADGPGSALSKLDRVLREFVPTRSDDQSWVLWIDAWAAALRDEALRKIITELDNAWIDVVEQVLRDGAASGEFRCPDPSGSALRLSALIDGLGIRMSLQDRQSRRAALQHARLTAAREIGVDVEDFPKR